MSVDRSLDGAADVSQFCVEISEISCRIDGHEDCPVIRPLVCPDPDEWWCIPVPTNADAAECVSTTRSTGIPPTLVPECELIYGCLFP